ncbi:sulfotransferase 6B1-like [Alosa sapidissima]|uniref:sulfotransferase 6B1-like n=1 Tax=Alosa sapidissima TaxID=34773 RepID=UPI001C09F8FC|nr:sulfotransferase 6B1-like [Alosa sapidissima]
MAQKLTLEERVQQNKARAQSMPDEEKVFRYKGILYPTIMSPMENLEALRTLEARQEDVVLVAYPKCGFHWMVGVLRKIMSTAAGKTIEMGPPHLEFMSPDMQKALAQEASPRLMATHLHPDEMHPSFREKKAKILVVWRNPKDTLVSFYHFMNKNPVLPSVEWDKFFSDFMSGEVLYGSYFDHAVAWEKLFNDPNVKMITFEDMKEDLIRGIREVSQFFGFTLTDEQIQTISGQSTFDAMKDDANKTHGKFSHVVFRKGEVGDWRNHFSEAQSQQMDEEFNKRLAGTKLGALLQYDTYCK